MSSSETDSEVEEVQMPNDTRNFRDIINFDLTGADFRERFRLTTEQTEQLINRIGDDLSPATKRSRSISAKHKLLMSLRFFATGDFFYSVGDSHGYSKASVCRAVHLTVKVINQRLFQSVVSWPQTDEERRQIAQQFHTMAGFPSVCGAVDGTLIPIQAPTEHEPAFVDRHGNHSLNAMMVAGPRCEFFYASVKWPGATHDARVLRNSSLFTEFEDGFRPFPNAILLGDSGYPLKQWLLTVIARDNLSAEEERYNRKHCKTRRIVECAFGILKNRFPSLRVMLRAKSPRFAAEVVKACTVLHNLCLSAEPANVTEEVPEDRLRFRDIGMETEEDESEREEPQEQTVTGRMRQREIINSLV